jgi:membrane-bound metal-dependent hydrolase YbcI (DUF457 family)
MPEWFTHVALGLLLAELFNVNKKSIVVLGAILPDILVKLTLVRLFIPIPNIDYSILGALHVPFVFFLFTLVAAPLFRYPYGRIVLGLNLGALSHFLSDALLRHVAGGGVRLLYPLSRNYYTAGLIWPEQSYLLGIALAIAYGLLLFLKKYRGKISAAEHSAAKPMP